jgi:hypothetical protein
MRWTIEVAFACLADFTVLKRPVMALLPMSLVLLIGFLLVAIRAVGPPAPVRLARPASYQGLLSAVGDDPDQYSGF